MYREAKEFHSRCIGIGCPRTEAGEEGPYLISVKFAHGECRRIISGKLS